jgi:DNA-binding NarL/FixJ family response regulator
MEKINLAIVDDHYLFRNGLKLLLSKGCSDLIGKIFEAGSGSEFLSLMETEHIDVVLMDIDMPGMDGIETTTKAILADNTLKVIALTMFGEDDYCLRMINAGAAGFLLKDTGITEVRAAIEKVLRGETHFPDTILYKIIKNETAEVNPVNETELSERELEILGLICRGYSNQEIADELFLSKRTVDKHRSNILFKTNCKNTAQLVVFALKNKLVEM